jgi:hypothetical protein
LFPSWPCSFPAVSRPFPAAQTEKPPFVSNSFPACFPAFAFVSCFNAYAQETRNERLNGSLRCLRRFGNGNYVNRMLMAVCLLLCVGCQMDKRFARIQTGMTKSQVIGILGKPDGAKLEDSSETLRWEAGDHYVKLKNGRVTEYGEE